MYQTATLEIELLGLPRIPGPRFDLKSLLPRTSDWEALATGLIRQKGKDRTLCNANGS